MLKITRTFAETKKQIYLQRNKKQGGNMNNNFENFKMEVWTNGRKLELLFETEKEAREYLEKLEKKYKDTYLLTIKKYK